MKTNFIDAIYKEIGENDSNQDVKNWLSTGILPLNKAISGKYSGGFPVGRITEVYGGESSGKTALLTAAFVETQKQGGLAMLLDYEHAFSVSRGRTLGLNTDKTMWIYKQPETAEVGFKMLEFVANEVRKYDSDKFITVGIDSVASMQTQAELEADYGDANMKSRLSLPQVMSDSLKKLATLVNNTNITLIFLNQTRANVGVLFGDKDKTSGGNALKFYASTRIKLSKHGKIKDDDKFIGEHIEAQIIKNKVFEPFGVAKYQSNFRNGVNAEATHIDELAEMGLLGETKGWLEWKDKKYRQSELERLLKNDRAMYEELLTLFKD